MIGSLWERELARKPATFSSVHKPATNRVNLAASQHWHHQNLTNLLTPHFEKLELARGMKSKLSKTMGSGVFLSLPGVFLILTRCFFLSLPGVFFILTRCFFYPYQVFFFLSRCFFYPYRVFFILNRCFFLSLPGVFFGIPQHVLYMANMLYLCARYQRWAHAILVHHFRYIVDMRFDCGSAD